MKLLLPPCASQRDRCCTVGHPAPSHGPESQYGERAYASEGTEVEVDLRVQRSQRQRAHGQSFMRLGQAQEAGCKQST